jgi:hypothetical protein
VEGDERATLAALVDVERDVSDAYAHGGDRRVSSATASVHALAACMPPVSDSPPRGASV